MGPWSYDVSLIESSPKKWAHDPTIQPIQPIHALKRPQWSYDASLIESSPKKRAYEKILTYDSCDPPNSSFHWEKNPIPMIQLEGIDILKIACVAPFSTLEPLCDSEFLDWNVG